MNKIITLFTAFTIGFQIANAAKNETKSTRIKELIQIKGVRSNPLVGYGIVTGLDGTGDSKSEIANATFKKIFNKLGLNLTKEIDSKNVAVVLVTARLPEFSRVGNKIDIKVSSRILLLNFDEFIIFILPSTISFIQRPFLLITAK